MAETVISSSVLIGVIILLRTLLKGRLSNTMRCGLWLIAAVRLMFPVSLIESPVSVMNLFSPSVTEEYSPKPEYITADSSPEMELPAQNGPSENTAAAKMTAGSTSESIPEKSISPEKAAVIIWVTGSAAMLLWFVIVNGIFAAGLARSRKKLDYDCPLRVYVSDELKSPCIFGLFRPSVYVTPKAAEDRKTLELVVTHELCHYYHGDTFRAVLRYLLLAVYWFDPFVWAAAVLSKRDCECACDEAVIRRIGADRRFEYGKAIIDMIPEEQEKMFGVASTSMSAEGRVLKERISFIAKNPRSTLSAVIVTAAAVLLAVCATFTSAPKISAENIIPEEIQSEEQPPEQAEETLSPTENELPVNLPDRLISDDLFSENIAERIGADGSITGNYSDESFGYIRISVPTANSSSVIGDLYLWQNGDMSLKIIRNGDGNIPVNAEVTEGTFCERPCVLYEFGHGIGMTFRDFEDGSYFAVVEYGSEKDEETAKRILSTIQPLY